MDGSRLTLLSLLVIVVVGDMTELGPRSFLRYFPPFTKMTRNDRCDSITTTVPYWKEQSSVHHLVSMLLIKKSACRISKRELSLMRKTARGSVLNEHCAVVQNT